MSKNVFKFIILLASVFLLLIFYSIAFEKQYVEMSLLQNSTQSLINNYTENFNTENGQNITVEIKDAADVTSKVNDNNYNLSAKTKPTSSFSSPNNFCKRHLISNLNVRLNGTVLQSLTKACLRKERENKTKKELILDKQFLSMHIGDNTCKEKKPRYLEDSEPLVALASFPGSGNTWTRVLLEGLTGIYTGSIYRDPLANFAGSKKCPTTGEVFIVKTHKASGLIQRKRCQTSSYSRAIFILRNPYDAILAEFNRMQGGKVGFAHEEDFSSNKWTKFVNSSKRWKKMVLFWMKQYKKPVYVLVYEDLKNNTMLEMYKLANFLNVKVTLKNLYCLVNQPKEEYYRTKKPDWLLKSKLFDKKMIMNINAILMSVGKQCGQNFRNVFENYRLL